MKEAEKHIAVVGAGYWGRNLVRNFHQLGVLKTICDGAPTVRAEMAAAYPGVAVTASYGDILADGDILAVVIGAPAARHHELAMRALQAGKHIFVEKPLSLHYDEGEAIVKLGAAVKRIVFVGHILNYHAAVIRLKELIRTGKIGRLQYIYSRRLSLGKIRREENILWSFAPHDISIILGIAGETPHFVDSVGNNFLHARIPDVTMTNLKFPSGIGAHIFVSWLNPFKEQKLVVVGGSGMLVFDDTAPLEGKLVLYPHTIDWQNGRPVPNKAEGVPVDLRDIWEEPLKSECRAFLAAVAAGAPPLTDGREGLRVLRVLELSQRSLERKERITESVYGQGESGGGDDFRDLAGDDMGGGDDFYRLTGSGSDLTAASVPVTAVAGAAEFAGGAPAPVAGVASVPAGSLAAPAQVAVRASGVELAGVELAGVAASGVSGTADSSPPASAAAIPAAPAAVSAVPSGTGAAPEASVAASGSVIAAGAAPEASAGFFVHPTAIIDDNCVVGPGTRIWHFSHVLAGTKIGAGCNIGQNVVIGPDVVIAARCKIQNNVSVYKGVTLEEGVFCGPSMVFTNIFNPRAEIGKMDQVRPTLVKRGATLGANCTIVCGRVIGRWAFIGAGAVVTKDVPDHALVAGNPARQIGWMCECGEKLNASGQCPACGKDYPDLGKRLPAW